MQPTTNPQFHHASRNKDIMLFASKSVTDMPSWVKSLVVELNMITRVLALTS